MTTSRHHKLIQRQQRLVLHSARLRRQMGEQANALKTPLLWIGLVPLALLSLQRPRRILGWTSGLLWAWRTLQQVRAAFAKTRP
jgi:hypothetical protein